MLKLTVPLLPLWLVVCGFLKKMEHGASTQKDMQSLPIDKAQQSIECFKKFVVVFVDCVVVVFINFIVVVFIDYNIVVFVVCFSM